MAYSGYPEEMHPPQKKKKLVGAISYEPLVGSDKGGNPISVNLSFAYHHGSDVIYWLSLVSLCAVGKMTVIAIFVMQIRYYLIITSFKMCSRALIIFSLISIEKTE